MRELRQAAQGADYFASVGNFLRVSAVVALAPFAVYFCLAGLLTPLIFVVFILVDGNWPIAWMLLGIGIGHGAFGALLGWLTLRLYRGGTSANQVTILPTWFIRLFLYLFLGPLTLAISPLMALEAFQAGRAGNVRFALMLGALSIGFVLGTLRAFRTAWRLSDRQASLVE